MDANEESRYTFDEGEQGQPAYLFVREGEVLYVSVVDSELSGASGNANYQQVSCAWRAFREATAEYLKALRRELDQEVPGFAPTWFERYASAA